VHKHRVPDGRGNYISMMAPNIGKSSAWNLLRVTSLASRILKLILEYG